MAAMSSRSLRESDLSGSSTGAAIMHWPPIVSTSYLVRRPLKRFIWHSSFGFHARRPNHLRRSAGRVKESAADFDKFLELSPDQAPKLWQRGISLYYAGRYEDGQRQFELHQTINRNDVENAVWHFLCVARRAGIDKARAALLKIENDPRVPMMQIYALYAGKGSAEDVMKAATTGKPSPNELNERLFYAHLYLGLYFDVAGNEKMAREHIVQAAELFKVDNYMGDVARIHAALMRQQSH